MLLKGRTPEHPVVVRRMIVPVGYMAEAVAYQSHATYRDKQDGDVNGMNPIKMLRSNPKKPAANEPDSAAFEAVRMLEVEISRPLPPIASWHAETGHTYRKALALVRLHTQPIGLVSVILDQEGLSADVYAQQIWHALGTQVNDHLRQDMLPAVQCLDATGLTCTETPRCLRVREEFLAHVPHVSVVIPTRDRPGQLLTCLSSIIASSYPRSCYEIIVVDNAPKTDGTSVLIDRMRDSFGDSPQLRYVREDYPGSGSARNRGLEIARSEIVVFLDDDVRVDEHCLTELVRNCHTAKEVACVTGLILPMDLETPAQLWLEQWGGYSKGFTQRLFDLTEHRVDRPFYPYSPGVYGSGASMAFRKSVLNAIGKFDRVLGSGTPALGGEDIEILMRTVLTGHTIVYAPAAVVHHPHHREYAQLRRQIYGYGAGLTACLLRTIVANPRLLPDFASKLPAGLLFTVNPKSAHHSRKLHDYPRELSVLELEGMLYGPLGYLRSWRQLRRYRTAQVGKYSRVSLERSGVAR